MRITAKYVERLNRDLARIAERVPPEKASAFKIAECDFETFCQNWERISGDPTLLQCWQRRLTPTGYDDDQARFRVAMGDLGFSESTANKAAA